MIAYSSLSAVLKKHISTLNSVLMCTVSFKDLIPIPICHTKEKQIFRSQIQTCQHFDYVESFKLLYKK